MNRNKLFVQIDATAADIVLDDLSKPYVYVTADGTGQLLTAKVSAEVLREGLEDCIARALDHISSS